MKNIITLETQLIGFKATIGLSRSGLVKNIRALEVIADTENCELASWSYEDPTETIRYEYLSNAPGILTVPVTLTTPWGQACPFTVSAKNSWDFRTCTFENDLSSFTMKF